MDRLCAQRSILDRFLGKMDRHFLSAFVFGEILGVRSKPDVKSGFRFAQGEG
jgi:hypothetical protein